MNNPMPNPTTKKIPVIYAFIQPNIGRWPGYIGVHLPNHSTVAYDPKIHEIIGDIPLEAIPMIEEAERKAGEYDPDDPDHERP